jgi:superfamily I DNA and/or RNA helicase
MDMPLIKRLITNGLDHVNLFKQHRMRPEIAGLIKHAFVPELKNGPNVSTYPDIKGLQSNIFFLNHSQAEDCVKNSNSKTNLFEANFVLSLANYLIYDNGYDRSQITILTMYFDQKILIENLDHNLKVVFLKSAFF